MLRNLKLLRAILEAIDTALDGKGTYLGGVGFLLYGVGGWLSGELSAEAAIAAVLAGWTILRGRKAVKKIEAAK